MRILQLSPQFPFPYTDGGKISIANTYKYLSELNCEVTFFSFSEEPISNKFLIESEKYGKVIIYPYSTKNTPKRIFKSVFDNYPIYLRKHINSEICNFIDSVIENNQFDIIHADHSAMAPLALYIKNKYNIPVGLRLHNVEYKIWQRYAENLPFYSPKKYYVSRQAKLLKNAEKKIYHECDACFSITNIDRKAALELSPKANVVNVNAGVNIDEWAPIETEKNKNELIFASNFHWIHNVNAIDWFIENVMPELKSTFPNLSLVILGKHIPERYNSYKSIGVNPVGFVPEIQSYLNKANVYIAPLFVGSGVRIKILEAMSMGLPVVASPISAEGIEADDKDGLFIAKNKDDYVKMISNLLMNNDLRISSGIKARDFILKNHLWKSNIGIIKEQYQNIINSR